MEKPDPDPGSAAVPAQDRRLCLGPYTLDLAAGELHDAAQQIVPLRRQALEVLLILGRRAGHVVGKDELLAAVWPNVVVGETSLPQAVADIRRALGDVGHRVLRNVARRGYLLAPDAPARSDRPVADPAAAGAPPAGAPAAGAPPSPADRPRSGAPSLRWPAWIAALVVVAGAVVALAWSTSRSVASPWQTPEAAARAPLPADAPALSVAVLPFDVEAGTDPPPWLLDALHGDLIVEMTRPAGSFVIGRDTMTTYRGRTVDARTVARELGVRHVVRGRVRLDGSQLTLSLALIDGETGLQSWADRFTTERAQLPYALQDFALGVHRTLQGELYRAGAQRLPRRALEQVDADELAMRGLALWFRGVTRENLLAGLPMFERAVQLDPNSSRAWHGVATFTLHAMLNGWAGDRASALQRIEQAAAQLERIDFDGHLSFNARTIVRYLKGDATGMLGVTTAWTERHRQPVAFGAHGMALLVNGRFDEAVLAEQQAIRLSPRDPFRAEWEYRLAMAHFAAGRYEMAREWAQTAASRAPGLRWPPVHVAALVEMGQHDAARTALADFLSRHRPIDAVALQGRLPGAVPKLVEARERLAAALARAALP